LVGNLETCEPVQPRLEGRDDAQAFEKE